MAATSLDFARDCLEHRRRPGPQPARSAWGSTTTREAACRRSRWRSTIPQCSARVGVNGSCRSTGSSRVPTTGASPDEILVSIRRGPLPARRLGRTRRWPTRHRAIRSSGSARPRLVRGLDLARARRGHRRRRSRIERRRPSRPSPARRFDRRGGGRCRPCDRRPDRQQRYLRRPRVSVEDGRGLCSARHRRGARPAARSFPASGIARRAAHPRSRAPARPEGAVLTRDLTVDGKRWSKGRRLSSDDLLALAAGPGPTVTVLVPTGNELHEDEAALR